jgi:hypothetical protein
MTTLCQQAVKAQKKYAIKIAAHYCRCWRPYL